MQIVIDIDEYEYKRAKELVSEGLFEYNGTTAHIFKSVVTGTPLPDKHGRLIDADSLIKAIEEKAKRLNNADTINGLCGAVALIFDEQAVIEADKKSGVEV